MKKLLKILGIASIFAAILGFGFVGCDNGSNDDEKEEAKKPDEQKPGEEKPGEPKFKFHWTFDNIVKEEISAELTPNQSGGSVDSLSKVTLKTPYEVPAKEVTPADAFAPILTLNTGINFNSIDIAKTIGESKQTVIYGLATKGAIEPQTGDGVSVEVKGPFKATMYASTNSDSDKTDRYAYIKIGETEYCIEADKSAKKLPAAGTIIVADYKGTDKVTVNFGGTGITRIYDIIIETDVDQNPGAFVSQTDDSLANDEATIGFVGTAVESSDSEVATAEIKEGKIVITSVKKGLVTLTVKSATPSYAEIPVSVGVTGAITIDTANINKVIFTGETKTFTDEEIGAVELAGDITAMTAAPEGIVNINMSEDANPSITALKPGEAVLSITDGTYTAKIPVTVDKVGKITLGELVNPFIPKTVKVDVTNIKDVTAQTDEEKAIATATLGEGEDAGKVIVTSVAEGEIKVKGKLTDAASPKTSYSFKVTVGELGDITVGEVETFGDFAATTKDDIAPTDLNLDLTDPSAEATSDDETIATATVSGGKVVITSVAAGNATITVTVGEKSATIEVEVKADGTIAVGTITPASSFDGWDASAILSKDNFTKINTCLTAATYVKKEYTPEGKSKITKGYYVEPEAGEDYSTVVDPAEIGIDKLKVIYVTKEFDSTQTDESKKNVTVNYTNFYTKSGESKLDANDAVLGINSPDAGIRMRDTGVLNFNGDTGRYLSIDTSELDASGDLKITINMKMTSADKSGTVYMLDNYKLKDDESGTADSNFDPSDSSITPLATATSQVTDAFDFTGTVPAGTKVYFCYKRSTSGSGGVDINSISIEPASAAE